MHAENAGEKAACLVLTAVRVAAAVAQQDEAEARRPGQRQHQRREQRGGHGDGEGAEEAAGHAGDRDQREKHDHRGDGRSNERDGDFLKRFAHSLDARLAVIAVHHDVLDHDDGVVDHQADRRGEPAERHQVEALLR